MANPETKTCKHCNAAFTISSEDFDFYERIKVPPPTWCPTCRQKRRYAWRNERVLYRRNCDLCGKSIVTIYSPNKPFKVYCPPCWWSDKWNGTDHGRDFDFSRPFFEQWQELQLQVPRIALLSKNNVNSEYVNHASNDKNCYLCFGIFDSEDTFYSTNVWKNAKNCSDCHHLDDGAELLYECIDAFRCYQSQFCYQARDCSDCLYCYDCRGCSNCFLSYNLRNKQYCILNEQYSREDYFKKLEEYRLDTHEGRQKVYTLFCDMIAKKALHEFAVIERSERSSGNMIFNSKNVVDVFDIDRSEDCKYAIVVPEAKDVMDSYHIGIKMELIYECHALVHDYETFFTHLSYDNSRLAYCDGCHNSQDLFGCVGVKQGSRCIFNKKYGDEEYAALRAKIIEHMKKGGEYGEFFPPQLSPFGYNETQGQVYMPMTKEEALADGWKWEDALPGTFGKETIAPDQIPAAINDVQDSIVKEALKCIQCSRNYNIIQPELDLYRRLAIPVPRLCPDCRYKRRIALRPPRLLWKRACMCAGASSVPRANTAKHFHGDGRCPNEFQTSYAPDRAEIVYCEQCYQAEVA